MGDAAAVSQGGSNGQDAADAAWTALESEGGGDGSQDVAMEEVQPRGDDKASGAGANEEGAAGDDEGARIQDGEPGARARGPDGKFVKAEKGPVTKVGDAPAKGAESKAASPQKAGHQTTETKPPESGATTATPAIKPPQSWSQAAKEKWAAVPTEVQQEFAKRELQTRHLVNEAAELRKFHQGMTSMVTPYLPMLQAEGATPQKAFGDLLQQAYVMRQGSPQQKAAMVANWMRQFGIDGDAVADALDGKGGHVPAAPPPEQRPVTMAELQSFWWQQQQQSQLQQNSSMVQQWEQGKEFLDDVREDLADLVSAQEARGATVTPALLDSLYAKACKLNDRVAGILSQREAAKRAAAPAGTIRTVSTSVRGSPSGVNHTAKKEFRNGGEAADAAWDEIASG